MPTNFAFTSAAVTFGRNTLKYPTAWLLAGRGVQLLNAVVLSAIVVRHFGLSMVGTYAVGYIAVAFVPHFLALGLNSELPRHRRPVEELTYIAVVLQAAMLLIALPFLWLYSTLMARAASEFPIIFLISASGCCTGAFNVAVTLNILVRSFRICFFAPLAETTIIVAGYFFAHSGVTLAGFVLAGKALTLLFIWPKGPLVRVPRRNVLGIGRQGSKYLVLDLLNTLSEQIVSLLLGIMAPRFELGQFRLCQQTMSAAETPGWSYVQGQYPAMTFGDDAVARTIEKHQIKIGAGASVLCALAAFPIAYLLFHTPAVARMMLVLSAALVSRYIMYFNDQRLRAEGRTRSSALLVLSRIILYAGFLVLAIPRFGIWTGIATMAVGAVLYGWVYQRVAHRQLNP